MAEIIVKSFDAPDEVLETPKVKMELAKIGRFEVWRFTAEPGWRYSKHMGPSDGTDRCEAEHALWLMTSGTLAVQMDDGITKEFGPGEVGSIPPGHEAWVVGDEPVVAFDVLPGRSDGQA
jgi:quercetin dioxygenase-like cupin family protein